MTRYLGRKLLIYLVTFWVAVTIDWAIPRFMPGDPIERLLARMQAQPAAQEALEGYYTEAFGFDVPIWKQYLNFWAALFDGDLGNSIANFPTPGLRADPDRAPVHARAAHPRDPAQLLGGQQGGRARGPAEGARQHGPAGQLRAHGDASDVARDHARLDLRLEPRHLPGLGAYALDLQPEWSLEFARSFLEHWILPFSAPSSSPSAAGRSGCGT